MRSQDDDNTRTNVILTQGMMVSYYRIVEKIGAGGMGEVYLAEDTELDRKVALKFLPQHLCQDENCRARFKREAQAAAKLDHPNVVTIHEVSEYQGRPFIVMQHVEGQTLADFITGKELPLDTVIDLAIQVGEGLGKAHQAGVVHRDIKPSNIVMDGDGRPKLLDFGLAAVQGCEKLTREGLVMGTVAYMSPEQAQGKEADQCSDLFSFGALLYELVTGRTPFQRDNEAATLQAIVHDTPEPLARYKAGVSEELQRVVSKALHKDLNCRYRTASDLLADLRNLQSQSRPTPGDSRKLKMLVVLPFENLGPPEEEYFSDGMTEEIISRLSAVRGLGVISRTSAMQYKQTRKSIRQIAQDLGVEYVLEGSVRWNRSGEGSGRVRITPQLIQVSDDTNLWSERYDRVIDDIFAVQSDIAEQVIREMDLILLKPARRILQARPTENIDAYQAYLRGLDYAGRPDYLHEDFLLAVQMFERAVQLDPGFAVAHADLARAHSALFFHGHDRTEMRVSMALAAVERALELQPELPDVHLALGYYHYWCHQDYGEALREFAIAEKNLPNDTRILAAVAAIAKRQGRMDETVDKYKKAYELSPRDAGFPHEIGCACMTMRRYTEAEHYYDRSISLAPDQVLAYVCKAWNHWLQRGDNEGARVILEKAVPRRVAGRSYRPEVALFEWHRLELFSRNYDKALAALDEVSEVYDEGQWCFIPRDLLAAFTCQLMGNSSQATALYESAAKLLEARKKEQPDDDRVRASLGIAYAGLEQKERAVDEGRLAVRLVPVCRNAVIGPFRVEDLAHIYTQVGELDAAVKELEYLLSIPAWLSVHVLRLDPKWDPLRDHSRFQALIKKYEKEHGT